MTRHFVGSGNKLALNKIKEIQSKTLEQLIPNYAQLTKGFTDNVLLDLFLKTLQSMFLSISGQFISIDEQKTISDNKFQRDLYTLNANKRQHEILISKILNRIEHYQKYSHDTIDLTKDDSSSSPYGNDVSITTNMSSIDKLKIISNTFESVLDQLSKHHQLETEIKDLQQKLQKTSKVDDTEAYTKCQETIKLYKKHQMTVRDRLMGIFNSLKKKKRLLRRAY